jgi:ribosomal protein S12 methylthiotransferase accessory factor YcaO
VLPSFNCSPRAAEISALVEFLERDTTEVFIVFVFKRFVIKKGN